MNQFIEQWLTFAFRVLFSNTWATTFFLLFGCLHTVLLRGLWITEATWIGEANKQISEVLKLQTQIPPSFFLSTPQSLFSYNAMDRSRLAAAKAAEHHRYRNFMETADSIYNVLQHLDGRLVSAIDILKPIGSTSVSDPLTAPSSPAAATPSPTALCS
jgi:hypothetical protein